MAFCSIELFQIGVTNNVLYFQAYAWLYWNMKQYTDLKGLLYVQAN